MRSRGYAADLDVEVHTSVAENCDAETDGCCNTGMCGGIFVPAETRYTVNAACPPGNTSRGCVRTPSQVALHEYTHQALLDRDLQDPGAHPPLFWAVLAGAEKRLAGL